MTTKKYNSNIINSISPSRIKFLMLLLILTPALMQAQSVGIGTPTPSSSAALDISSTSKGFLMPRMTTAQRDAIASPVEGLSIFNTDDGCTDVFISNAWGKNCNNKKTGEIGIYQEYWLQLDEFPGIGRYNAFSFSVGQNGYVGGGSGNAVFYGDLWKFNSSNNTWTQSANLPNNNYISAAVSFTIGDKAYVGTGFYNGSSYSNIFYEYNTISNTWTNKASFGGSSRNYAAGFAINNKGYIGTGLSSSGLKKDFWEYDPSLDNWVQKADFGGNARYNAVGAELLNKGYLGLGSSNNDFWEFTPNGGGLGTWVQKASFPDGNRGGAELVELGNDLYLSSGSESSSYRNDLWIYSDPDNSWIQIPSYGGVPRMLASSFVIGSTLFLLLGESFQGGYHLPKEVWKYTIGASGGDIYKDQIPKNTLSYKGHDWTSYLDNIFLSKTPSNVFNVDKYYKKIGIGRIADESGWDIGLGVGGNNGVTWALGSGGTSFYLGVGNGSNNSLKTAMQISSNRNLNLVPEEGNVSIGSYIANGELQLKNSINNRKLVLWETINNNHQFFGLGIESGTLRYQVAGTNNAHRFYAGASSTSSNLLFTIWGTGNATLAGTLTQNSDARLKKDIIPISHSLANILAINGYNYFWKDAKKDKALQSGILAQEVEKVMPHLVMKSDDGTLSVNYSGLIPELIEAIKEQQIQIEQLKKEKEAIKSDFQKRLVMLESKIK